MRATALLLALPSMHASESWGKEFKRFTLPNAKCLDGSPAVFYLAANQSSTAWVMWLQGGGACQSLDDCIDRSHGTLGSSTTYAESIDAPRGMISSDPSENPDLFTWNRVYVPYCSGDLWQGTLDEPVNPFPQHDREWKGYFHGHKILAELAEELGAHRAAAASDAVLTGCSAGGIGTIFNCDWFAGLFGPTTRVGCRPEAGWFGVPQASYEHFASPAGPSSDPDPLKLYLSNWTAKIAPYLMTSALFTRCTLDVTKGVLVLPPSCQQQALGAETCCLLPPHVYAYSRTRMFLSENTADAYQVFALNGAPKQAQTCAASVLNHRATVYWQYIRDTISASLTRLVVDGPKRGQDGLFAPACLVHCFNHWQGPLTLGGKTDQQAFGDWFFQRGANSSDDYLRLDNRSSPLTLCKCQEDSGAAADAYLTCSSDGFGAPPAGIELAAVAAPPDAVEVAADWYWGTQARV